MQLSHVKDSKTISQHLTCMYCQGKKYHTISHGGANNHLNYGYHKLLYAMLDERDIVPQI
jgi:hypothetical protein